MAFLSLKKWSPGVGVFWRLRAGLDGKGLPLASPWPPLLSLGLSLASLGGFLDGPGRCLGRSWTLRAAPGTLHACPGAHWAALWDSSATLGGCFGG